MHQSRLAEATSVYDPRLQQSLGGLRDLGLNPTQALGAITRTMSSQAYLMSALDFFWICGWISFSVAGIVWLTRRPRGAAHAVAAD